MTVASRPVLYSPDMLALAVELADYPFDESMPMQGHARSRICGSRIDLSASISADGTIAAVGLHVASCAVGQSAAAIFATACSGRSRQTIADTERGLQRWLKSEGPQPTWPRIEMLARAIPHPARHEAILLPWRAALDALSKGRPAR